MEVRGIGIINVAAIFGIGAFGSEAGRSRRDFAGWQDIERSTRMGPTGIYEILKLQVPHITIPIRPGRDIARLIEVAAMDQKLKGLGRNSAVEFNDKLLHLMETKET